MGTRSLTFVTEDSKAPIMCMYRQFDGYPSGHGLELATFLRPIKMVNGLSGGNVPVANGAGCLAAQIVAHFKDGPGGFYLHAPKKSMDCGQEYEYWIDCGFDTHVIAVTVKDPKKMIFMGDVEQFLLFCNRQDD